MLETIHGEPLLRALATQAAQPAWLAFWQGVSFLGDIGFYAAAIPVLFALAPRAFARRLAAGFLCAGAASEWLKVVVARPRLDPRQFGLPGPLEPVLGVDSSSFPSGHVTTALVVWGWIAWRAPSRAVRGACAMLIVLIAFSRLALLRHDLADLLGGLVLGTSLLIAAVSFERHLAPRLGLLPWVEQAALWLLLAIVVQSMARLVPTASALGTLCGLGAGSAWADERGLAKRAGRDKAERIPALALLGALASLLVITAVLAAARRWLAQIPWALFVVFALAGIWMSALEPRWISRRPAPVTPGRAALGA